MMKMPALLVHKAWRKQTDDNGLQVDVKNDKTVGLRGYVNLQAFQGIFLLSYQKPIVYGNYYVIYCV
jgi:hypothetical protein